jgi:hypothetical protein
MYVFHSSADYEKANYPFAAQLFDHHRRQRRPGIMRGLENRVRNLKDELLPKRFERSDTSDANTI